MPFHRQVVTHFMNLYAPSNIKKQSRRAHLRGLEMSKMHFRPGAFGPLDPPDTGGAAPWTPAGGGPPDPPAFYFIIIASYFNSY